MGKDEQLDISTTHEQKPAKMMPFGTPLRLHNHRTPGACTHDDAMMDTLQYLRSVFVPCTSFHPPSLDLLGNPIMVSARESKRAPKNEKDYWLISFQSRFFFPCCVIVSHRRLLNNSLRAISSRSILWRFAHPKWPPLHPSIFRRVTVSVRSRLRVERQR